MVIAVLIAAYCSLTALQIVLAVRYFNRTRTRGAGNIVACPVTILQPILSGDPRLESNLHANQANCPAATFLLLIDEDDPEAQRLTQGLSKIIRGPGPTDGENPKMAKLARALPHIETPTLVVLDDDTTITQRQLNCLTGSLNHAELVTGLPIFSARRTVYERLIGAFVNGNAILTYFPAAALGAQHTINGMIYACRTQTLRDLGGFAAIKHELTDDWAMARLFAQAGHEALQTPAFVYVSMTVGSPGHYLRVMRRWFIFANLYLRKNLSPATILLVALPPLFPLAGLLLAADHALAWLACVLARIVANRILLWRFSGYRSGVLDILLELIASFLLPLLYLSSLIRPSRVTWRNRRITLSEGRIHYR